MAGLKSQVGADSYNAGDQQHDKDQEPEHAHFSGLRHGMDAYVCRLCGLFSSMTCKRLDHAAPAQVTRAFSGLSPPVAGDS